MSRLKQLCLELSECEVGDYGFHLRERWPTAWHRLVMPEHHLPEFWSFDGKEEVPTDNFLKTREFEMGWTTAGIRIWVRTS